MRIVLPRLIWPRSRALMMPLGQRLVETEGTADGQHPLTDSDILAVTRITVGRSPPPSRSSKAMSDSGSFQTWIRVQDFCRLPG